MEKIWGNLKKGLRFYCRENGFSDVILGLSGGLDSAVVSVLAAEALGAEHVYCLMMKTGYTSALSLEIARELAEMNKFNYRVLDIQPLVDSQQKFLTAALGTEPKKVVVENLQARERGKILMALDTGSQTLQKFVFGGKAEEMGFGKIEVQVNTDDKQQNGG